MTAEDIPSEATALEAELTEMLPFAPNVSLLIELNKRTGSENINFFGAIEVDLSGRHAK
ncbi:hypothetical protein OH799_05800 [Nocardia sp. NBC_00881]|uniref:hypothetical protein n=1 Tax=Nocardia sp. NBC_00881 TaxID=2975995 RepID=UPI0038651600|nr:hypothetical protein OH799_05800 [Nocardia sp. NBC_00881]